MGETDSEVAACALFGRMAQLWHTDAAPTKEQRLTVVNRFAAELRAMGPANFIYADGELMFGRGHRRTQSDGNVAPPGLWVLHRQCAVDAEALAVSGVHISAANGSQEMVMLASVPLTDEPWRALQEGEVVVICKGVGP